MNVQNAFELGGRLEPFCAPLLARLAVVFSSLVYEGDACHEVVRRRDAYIDRLRPARLSPSRLMRFAARLTWSFSPFFRVSHSRWELVGRRGRRSSCARLDSTMASA